MDQMLGRTEEARKDLAVPEIKVSGRSLLLAEMLIHTNSSAPALIFMSSRL